MGLQGSRVEIPPSRYGVDRGVGPVPSSAWPGQVLRRSFFIVEAAMRLPPVILLFLAAIACGRSSRAQDQDTAKPDSSAAAADSTAADALAPSLGIDTTKLTRTESGLRMLDVTVGNGAMAED